ncbi:hypothetical protein [Campylobacter corcagiensis]|nr:hypothetical protein [Campylobacter corcagiensis]
MIDFIMTVLFVLFVAVTVIGFNKQMEQKRNLKDKKEDKNESID